MKVGVMGAGAIGCYVGGRLHAAGVDVVLVARAALVAELAQHGMHLSDYRGFERHLTDVRVETDAARLADRDAVIVTVKSGDTAAAGASLAQVLAPGAVVVSLQNGVSNPGALRAALPRNRVLAAMVPFNVLRSDGARFHQGTSGAIAVEPGAPALVAALRRAGIPAAERADIVAVQWGKLVFNLNNAVNALAGVPIRAMLLDADYRAVISAVVREALAVLAAAGIKPRLDPPLPPGLVPRLLALPTPVFRLAARSMIRVDPLARSSMWDDLARGRRTEIDGLNGEIVRLAARVGRRAPVNEALVELVTRAERGGGGSPQLSAPALRAALGV